GVNPIWARWDGLGVTAITVPRPRWAVRRPICPATRTVVPVARGMPHAAMLQHLSPARRWSYGSCNARPALPHYDTPQEDVVRADGGRQPRDARGDRAVADATWLRRDHGARRRRSARVVAATVVGRRGHRLEHAGARRPVVVAPGGDRAPRAAGALRADRVGAAPRPAQHGSVPPVGAFRAQAAVARHAVAPGGRGDARCAAGGESQSPRSGGEARGQSQRRPLSPAGARS